VLGYPAAEIIGDRYPLFTDQAQFDELFEAVLVGQTIEGIKLPLRARDGSRITVEIYASPLYEGCKVTGMIGSAVTVIDKPLEERISSTIRHNRARGTHQIRDMSTLVASLHQQGWDDERICDELGMELDEVIRLKQVSGLKDVFDGHEFSQSWTEYEDRHADDPVVGGDDADE